MSFFLRLALIVPLFITLAACGPTAPVENNPQILQKDLKVRTQTSPDRVNTFQLRSSSDDEVFVYFKYEAKRSQILVLEDVDVDVENTINCNYGIDLEWGEKRPNQTRYEFEEVNTFDRLLLKKNYEYSLKWTLRDLKGCGELDVEFEMSAI